MTNPPHGKRLLTWLGLLTLVVAGRVQAQPRRMEEAPQLFKLHVRDVSLLLDAQDRMEKSTSDDTGQSYQQDTRYLYPSLRLGADGSVYHPNLLSYNLLVREGVQWEDRRIEDDDVVNRDGRSDIQDYDARITLLRQEPYAVKLFASRHDLYREYDFFTRVKVDDQSVGGSAGYQAGLIPFLVTATHSVQNVDDAERPSSLNEDSVLLTAQNRRALGDLTDFRYSFNQFRREEEGLEPRDGWRQQARLGDTERFGAGGLSSLHTAGSYTRHESSSEQSSYFDAQEGLILQHAKALRSLYNYTYNGNRSDSVSGNNHYGRAALEHQLYESLSSAVDVHGSSERSDSEGSARETTTYGAALDENYVKRLSTWGRLRLDYHGRLDRRTQDGSGASITVVGESHVLTDGAPVFLNQPFADVSSIVVKDMPGAVIYREGLDYRVIPQGSQVELQRVVGGTIPNAAAVRVDYDAATQQAAVYDILSDSVAVRVDLLHNVLGIYGRLRQVNNYGDQSRTIEDLTAKTVGTDVRWRWLYAGAEYEDYDSSLTHYRASRLFQSLTCPITYRSSLGASARQTKYTYMDSDRDRDTSQVIGRYHVRVTSRLGVSLEGGVFHERGEGYDRRLKTFRSNVDFAMGQMSMRLKCEIEDETYLGGDRERRLIDLSARRTF